MTTSGLFGSGWNRSNKSRGLFGGSSTPTPTTTTPTPTTGFPDFSGFTPGRDTWSQVLDAIRAANLNSQWEAAVRARGTNAGSEWLPGDSSSSWNRRIHALKDLGWTSNNSGSGGGGGNGNGNPTPTTPIPPPAGGTPNGLPGSFPGYMGPIPWGMGAGDIRSRLHSDLIAAMAQAPRTTASPGYISGFNNIIKNAYSGKSTSNSTTDTADDEDTD